MKCRVNKEAFIHSKRCYANLDLVRDAYKSLYNFYKTDNLGSMHKDNSDDIRSTPLYNLLLANGSSEKEALSLTVAYCFASMLPAVLEMSLDNNGSFARLEKYASVIEHIQMQRMTADKVSSDSDFSSGGIPSWLQTLFISTVHCSMIPNVENVDIVHSSLDDLISASYYTASCYWFWMILRNVHYLCLHYDDCCTFFANMAFIYFGVNISVENTVKTRCTCLSWLLLSVPDNLRNWREYTEEASTAENTLRYARQYYIDLIEEGKNNQLRFPITQPFSEWQPKVCWYFFSKIGDNTFPSSTKTKKFKSDCLDLVLSQTVARERVDDAITTDLATFQLQESKTSTISDRDIALASAKEENAILTKRVRSLEKNNRKLQESNSALNKKLQTVSNSKPVVVKKSDGEIKRQLDIANSSNVKLQNRIKSLEEKVSNLEAQLGTAKREIADYTDMADELAFLKKQAELAAIEMSDDELTEAELAELATIKGHLVVGDIESMKQLRTYLPNCDFVFSNKHMRTIIVPTNKDVYLICISLMSHKHYYQWRNATSKFEEKTTVCCTRGIKTICRCLLDKYRSLKK